MPADPGSPPTVDDVRSFLRGRVADYKLPDEIRVVAELPRNALAVTGLTMTLSLELARMGVTVNAISPGANTRISATIPTWDIQVREPDDIAEDEYDPMDPAMSSPLVAWLCSDEAAYVSGKVFRVVRDTIAIHDAWPQYGHISNGGKRWRAEDLGPLMGRKVFGTQARGLDL